MALSFVVLLLSPIFVFVLPPFIAEGLYFSPENWYVFVSGASYLMYSVGFLFLLLSLFVLFLLNMRKISFFISLVCVFLAGLSFYVAAQNYTSLGYDSIAYREIFLKEERIYPWSEVERAVYIEVPDQESPPEYEFYFTDGEKLTVIENDTIFC